MFIETYYDDRAAVLGGTSEPVIPYPELSGEELTLWRKYLPIKRPIRYLYSRFNIETIPSPVITEIERAQKGPHPFDRIEIWSRTDDPIAVGVIGDEKPRYFSIARWGDAELTLEEVRERLRIDKWLLRLILTGRIFVFLVVTLAIYSG
jgi:hypothetical protein